MALDTTFVSKVTSVLASWLNPVNNFVFKGRSQTYATSTGSANAYTVNLANSAYTSAVDGDTFFFKANFTNTGSATLTLTSPGNSVGPFTFQYRGANLTGGEIQNGAIVIVVLQSTNAQLIGSWKLPGVLLPISSIAGTANAITGAVDASVQSYEANKMYLLIPTGNNSAATTINLTPTGGSALGARNIFSDGLACVGGELRTGVPVVLVDDGTRLHSIYPPQDLSKASSPTFVGLTLTGALNLAAEVSVATAATCAIGAAASSNVLLTGVVTVTAFDTVAAGITRTCRAQGAFTLTYNASSLIIPGAANIPVAAGDCFEAESLGSGNWVVRSYTRATGGPPVAITNVQTFTATGAGTWTKPSLGTMAFIECWGSGGGGATGGATASGGGGGGYSWLLYPLSSLNATESVSVGTGGVSVSGNNINGGAGVNSWFKSSSFLFGVGGGAGQTNGNSVGGSSMGIYLNIPIYEGGGCTANTAGGPSLYGGGAGGGGTAGAAGGASGFAGAGGAAAVNGTSAGTAGTAPSGGGGSSTNGFASGAGGRGQVRVTCW